MFVPKATTSSSGSLRNPRRRQRTGSDESVKPPSAKRQRSILRQENSETNPGGVTDRISNIQPVEHSVSTSLNAVDSIPPAGDNLQKAIPIRSSKKPEKRKNDSVDAVVLSKTDFYTVSQLPCLPDQIRNIPAEAFRCSFASSQGYGLALTPSDAIIWPYSSMTSSPSPSDVFRLSIPESHGEPEDSLPLGVILSTATSTSPGLMVLLPHTGKIIYWETVSCAASLGLPRQKQTGIHGSIPGILSGEYATEIVNGEPSGVIVTFSSGRVAHITVRDSQGKPAVTVSFLKNPSISGRTGFFDGIKNVLGGGFWRKEVAAVCAGESHQRGQRDIIIATSTGVFEVWDTHWNNGSMLKRQFDVKEDIQRSLGMHSPDNTNDTDIKILDFSFTESGQNTDDLQSGVGKSWLISILVAMPRSAASQSIFVVQMRLSESIHILSTNTINSHDISTGTVSQRPRILVPNPGGTAFIILGQSVILLSLARIEASPSSQLLLNKCELPAFQDCINFRPGKGYEILGTGSEDQSDDVSSSACLIMIRDFGVIRITVSRQQETPTSNEDAQITAQQKIEQAVFYGTMLGNPLNLASKSGLDFPAKEIEEASSGICKGLLQSTSKFIPTAAISVDQNLKLRARALDDLSHLLMEQNKALDRRIWWELLWGAEKLAAQRAMWKLEETARKSKSKGPTFLAHVIDLMSDKFKTKLDLLDDTNDPVRHWFIYDTYRMEHIVPWIFNAIKPQKGNSSKQMRRMSEQIFEASELSLAVLETAFKYRDEHANQFGIGDGYLEEGILTTDYEGLPEFWTSQSISYSETGHLLDLELDSCRAWIQQTTIAEGSDQQTIKKIARNSARHLRILGQMHLERIRWLSAQDDPKLIDQAIATEQSHKKQRKWQLFKLAGIGQLEDAIDLAENFRDMGALVELIIELQDQSKGDILAQDSSEDNPDGISSASRELNKKITHYFEKFGESWADAFFSRQIAMGQSGILFSMKRFQPFITRFLHKHPTYSKLSWINDVIGESDYDSAASTLENLALKQESDIWSHRVELSLAKLAKLSAWEKNASSSVPPPHADIKRLEDFAEMGAVQEVIYAHISPVFQGAIDQKAEVELAMEHFGNRIAKDMPSLHELLGEALIRVVSRKVLEIDQLIDLLTLIDLGQVPESAQNELLGKEFYLALRVIRLSLYARRDPHYNLALQKLIWRRCIINDNWDATGKAVEKMGSESEALLYATSLFRTLGLCLRDRHTDGPSNPSIYIPTRPQDVLLNETDSDLISSRFRPERRSRIMHDLDKENEILTQCIEKGELEFWFSNLLSSAEKFSHSIDDDTTAQQMSNVGFSSDSPESSIRKSRLSWL